jgi:hypothetical protein
MNKEEIEGYFDDLAEAMQAVWSKYGWIQNDNGNDESGYCLQGCWYRVTNQINSYGVSTSQAATDVSWFLALNKAFNEAVSVAVTTLFSDSHNTSVIGFNDNDSRSEEDVRLVAKHAVTSLADYME